MNCREARRELGASALGALDQDTARALEEHLAACPGCRAEAAAYQEATTAFPLWLPLRRAPAALRERVLSAVRRPLPHAPPRTDEGQRWRWALAAAAAVVLAAVLSWAIILQREVNDLRGEQRRLVTAQATASALLQTQAEAQAHLEAQRAVLLLVLGEDVSYLEMRGPDRGAEAKAVYVWSRNQRLGVLLADGLSAPPPDMTYEFWFETGEGEVSGGTFAPSDDGAASLVVHPREGMGRPRSFVVTLEPAKGSPEAEGPVVLRGDLP